MAKTKLQSCPVRAEGFVAYAGRLIETLKAARKPVAEKYGLALNKFIKFYGENEVPFSAITPQLMSAFECWMRSGVVRNTSSFYMRSLHAIYNRALADGLAAPGTNPFLRVYTGVDKTKKRALTPELIKRIKHCDLSGNRRMAFARDVFMLSFYLRGMSFVDMAYLRRSDVRGGSLSYCRRKTGQPIIIKWLPEMEAIVNRHAAECIGDFLLPIVSSADFEVSRNQYKAGLRKVNRWLAKLGEELGLPVKLTTYVARHSWASTAQARRVPLSVISRCLGHDSEKTTLIYLASIETSELDDANDLVIQSVL